MVVFLDWHMGSIGKDFATSNKEQVARCDRCTEKHISCYVKVSTYQRFKPLECVNCMKEQRYCVFSHPIIGKPSLSLSNNCTKCQRAHQRCVFDDSSDDCCNRCKKKGSLCAFAPLKQGRRSDLKM